MNGYGYIFENFGIVPEEVFCCDDCKMESADTMKSKDVKDPVEHDYERCNVEYGRDGEMTCLEYAAKEGFHEILESLIENSENKDILTQYLNEKDTVERAFLISKNKSSFLDNNALKEINRYEAALFTAIAFGRTECLTVLLRVLSISDLHKHLFLGTDGKKQSLSAAEFALLKNQTACYRIIQSKE